MTVHEISKLYKEIGLGTESERNTFINLSDLCKENKSEYYFITNTPSSKLDKEDNNA